MHLLTLILFLLLVIGAPVLISAPGGSPGPDSNRRG